MCSKHTHGKLRDGPIRSRGRATPCVCLKSSTSFRPRRTWFWPRPGRCSIKRLLLTRLIGPRPTHAGTRRESRPAHGRNFTSGTTKTVLCRSRRLTVARNTPRQLFGTGSGIHRFPCSRSWREMGDRRTRRATIVRKSVLAELTRLHLPAVLTAIEQPGRTHCVSNCLWALPNGSKAYE